MLNICFLEQNPNLTDFLTGNLQTKRFIRFYQPVYDDLIFKSRFYCVKRALIFMKIFAKLQHQNFHVK
jgi:hypothetical protein